ncbi:C-terminal binding protein [Haloferacaceae archaeon DSL9]
MPTVLLSETSNIDPGLFEAALPDDIAIESASLGRAEALVERGRDADVVVLDNRTPAPAEAIERLPSLRGIVRAAVGVDNIDLEAAAEAGVPVTHVPEYCTDEVATHAMSLLLAGIRRHPQYAAGIRDGEWDWQAGRPIPRLKGSTIGLVSFGDIARRVATQLSGFDVTVVASDPNVDADEMAEYDVERVGFEECFERATHVSVHAPLLPATEGMVDADAISKLGPESVLVNVGRGGVVVEAAVLEALEADELGAAGFDVFEEEPPEDNPLVGRDDVLVTPHAGWYSEAAREDLNTTAAEDARRLLAGEEPKHRVDSEDGY